MANEPRTDDDPKRGPLPDRVKSDDDWKDFTRRLLRKGKPPADDGDDEPQDGDATQD